MIERDVTLTTEPIGVAQHVANKRINVRKVGRLPVGMRNDVLNLTTAVEKDMFAYQSVLRSTIDGQGEHTRLPVEKDVVAMDVALLDELDVVEEDELGHVMGELIVAEIRKQIGLHNGDVGHVSTPCVRLTLVKLALVSIRPPGSFTNSACRLSYPRPANRPALTCCPNKNAKR